jgi:hypothetical protein
MIGARPQIERRASRTKWRSVFAQLISKWTIGAGSLGVLTSNSIFEIVRPSRHNLSGDGPERAHDARIDQSGDCKSCKAEHVGSPQIAPRRGVDGRTLTLEALGICDQCHTHIGVEWQQPTASPDGEKKGGPFGAGFEFSEEEDEKIA